MSVQFYEDLLLKCSYCVLPYLSSPILFLDQKPQFVPHCFPLNPQTFLFYLQDGWSYNTCVNLFISNAALSEWVNISGCISHRTQIKPFKISRTMRTVWKLTVLLVHQWITHFDGLVTSSKKSLLTKQSALRCRAVGNMHSNVEKRSNWVHL